MQWERSQSTGRVGLPASADLARMLQGRSSLLVLDGLKGAAAAAAAAAAFAAPAGPRCRLLLLASGCTAAELAAAAGQAVACPVEHQYVLTARPALVPTPAVGQPPVLPEGAAAHPLAVATVEAALGDGVSRVDLATAVAAHSRQVDRWVYSAGGRLRETARGSMSGLPPPRYFASRCRHGS